MSIASRGKNSLRVTLYTSVKQGKFGAAMKTTYGVNSAVRRTLSACKQQGKRGHLTVFTWLSHTVWHGCVMVIGRRMRDRRRIAYSTPDHTTSVQRYWTSCSRTGAFVTKQYNLVVAKGRWCSAPSATKNVIAAWQLDSNGSQVSKEQLTLGRFMIVKCGLTALRAPASTTFTFILLSSLRLTI